MQQVAPFDMSQYIGDSNSAYKAMSDGVRTNGPGAFYDPYIEKYLDNMISRENTARAEAFSERMASTQYQRAVADLKAAGLNPWLAVSSPSAAPAGQVATASTVEAGLGQRAASQKDTEISLKAIKEIREFFYGAAKLIGSAAAAMFG